tara:strand:+ start:1399 stop:1629 length:231 start_codon:yes stop_codon:yes gene_type:complete
MDIENIFIDNENKKINKKQLHKLIFLYNALENGWTIFKSNDKYVFRKKHHDDKEIFLDSYLTKFINNNITINNILL